MKTKWILAGLMAVALGVAALGMTGCSKSEHEHGSGEHMHDHSTSTPTPAPDTSSTNAGQAAPNTNQVAPEIKLAPAMQYTCTMHPEVVQDKPGRCPKCGMKLVEKK